MAPVVLPILSSRLFSHKVANSTSSIKKHVSSPSVAFSASSSSSTFILSSSTPLSKSSIPTVLPYVFHERFSTIVVGSATTTYTSYIELNSNAVISEPTPLSDSTPIGDSYAVETQAPQPNNTGRDIGIVIGCIIGVLILGLIGWVYMMSAKQSQRKRRKRKGKEKELVKETVEVKVKVKRRKHKKHRKHRKTEEAVAGDTGGEAPAAEGA